MVSKIVILGCSGPIDLQVREHEKQHDSRRGPRRWNTHDLQKELKANSVALLAVKELSNHDLGKVGAIAFDKQTSDSGEFPPGMWKQASDDLLKEAGAAARPMLLNYLAVVCELLTGSKKELKHPYRWAEESLAIVVDEEALLKDNHKVNLPASFLTGQTLVNRVGLVLKSDLAD